MMVSKLQWAGLVAAVVIGAAQLSNYGQPEPTFQEIRPSVYKLNYWWSMIPGFPRMPIASWLIESSTLISPKSWTLIDTGTDVPANQQALVQGIKAKLASSGGTLKLILSKQPRRLYQTVPNRMSRSLHADLLLDGCSNAWSWRSCWWLATCHGGLSTSSSCIP